MAVTAFIAKFDFAALSSVENGLILKDHARNGSNQSVKAVNQKGDTIAYNVFGTREAPVVNYELTADLTDFAIVLGTVNTVDTAPYLVKQVDFKTAAATPVGMSATTEKLQAGATASSTIDMGTISLTKLHKAQFIADSFTLGGTGCSLQANDISFKGNATFGEVASAIKSHDMSGGEITQSITIQQTGATLPTVTAGSGWEILDVLKETANPEADYPTWTCTLHKFVASTEPEA
jgi:hypothetical protein